MIKEFLKQLFSTIKALVRLALITNIFVLEGAHQVIFNRREIVSFEFIFTILSADEDKVSFLEKLNDSVFGDEYYEGEEFNEGEQ